MLSIIPLLEPMLRNKPLKYLLDLCGAFLMQNFHCAESSDTALHAKLCYTQPSNLWNFIASDVMILNVHF